MEHFIHRLVDAMPAVFLEKTACCFFFSDIGKLKEMETSVSLGGTFQSEPNPLGGHDSETVPWSLVKTVNTHSYQFIHYFNTSLLLTGTLFSFFVKY